MIDDVVNPLSCQRSVGRRGAFNCVHLSKCLGEASGVYFVGKVVWMAVVHGYIFSKEEGYEEKYVATVWSA